MIVLQRSARECERLRNWFRITLVFQSRRSNDASLYPFEQRVSLSRALALARPRSRFLFLFLASLRSNRLSDMLGRRVARLQLPDPSVHQAAEHHGHLHHTHWECPATALEHRRVELKEDHGGKITRNVS